MMMSVISQNLNITLFTEWTLYTLNQEEWFRSKLQCVSFLEIGSKMHWKLSKSNLID